MKTFVGNFSSFIFFLFMDTVYTLRALTIFVVILALQMYTSLKIERMKKKILFVGD